MSWAAKSPKTAMSDGARGRPWNAYQFDAVSLSCAYMFWYDLLLHSRQRLNFFVTVKSLPLDGAVMKIPW